MKYFSCLLIVAALLLSGCKTKSSAPPGTPSLEDSRLDEISGIAASVLHPGYFYIHNDSGDTSRFFTITPDGKLKGIFYFKGDPAVSPGVTDCEDIAVGAGPDSGGSYVYVGDIGDNNAVRSGITVYRVKEPALPAAGASADVPADALHLKYPDGARDAETLMTDPIARLLYIVSKREDTVHIYTAPLDFKANDTVVLQKQAQVFFEGTGEFKWITAGDISQDGQQVLLKSYSKVYYWKRSANEPIWQTLQGRPTILPYTVEPQGEAIGFTTDGKGYYTVSEGAHALVYYYKL